MTLDLSCDSFRIVINNGFMLWNLKLCETSADTSGPFTHTWRKNTPSDALTLHLIAACEAHWIKSNLKIWKDCQLHLKSAQLPVLNVGILLLCKPRIRRLYMSYISYQYIWADCSACECHDDQGFAEILKWARQLPSHKPLINHCVSTFVSRNPLVLLPVVLFFVFLAASKCHRVYFSLQTTTTATTTTVLSLLCSAALLPLCRWQPVDREPPSHQQLWWEMCPLPPFPASCPHPPPLHKGLPKGGRHLGSACVLQPSSAQLHTGKHNTHTHTHTHTHTYTHTQGDGHTNTWTQTQG